MPEVSWIDGPLAANDRANEIRLRIRELIKDTRQQRKMSQADLGTAIGKNRFVIIRIERGLQDVTPDQAELLDQVLGLNELSTLVDRLNRTAGVEDNRRDSVVRSLFHDAQPLESVTVVVADDLDVFGAIYDSAKDSMRLDARDIKIVFPTAARERELYGDTPLWGYFEYQIKHLTDLQGADIGPSGELQVYESDRVIAACIIASTRTGSRAAYWPSLPVGGGAHRVEGATIPVVATEDISTTRRLEAHVQHVLESCEPLRANEALCRLDRASAGPRFTRYFAVGTDQEEDVAEDEGFAVTLVLATALCPRRHYGVGLRVIMYKRPSARHDRGLLSLFSNNVDDADIRAARAIETGAEPELARSTRSALAATLDINGYLGAKDGLIPDLAYQIAGARELAMFGLDVKTDRLKRVDLPAQLQLIRKPGESGLPRAAVAPNVFVLELEPFGAEPELDVLSEGADSEVVGVDDIAESDKLNSFLVTARESGFLIPMLERLGVVNR